MIVTVALALFVEVSVAVAWRTFVPSLSGIRFACQLPPPNAALTELTPSFVTRTDATAVSSNTKPITSTELLAVVQPLVGKVIVIVGGFVSGVGETGKRTAWMI